jgi:rod shape-determining protein MreD
MKRGLALLLAGVVALMLQGAAALVVPARFLPDLGLLLVIGLALCLRSTAAGVLLAALLGYASDLLSGTLLGQHALLRMAAYAAARFGSARLNLRGPLPQALFVMLLSVAYACALWALVAFFVPGAGGAPLLTLHELLPHAVVNGVCAPFVSAAAAALSSRLGDDEPGKPMRLEPRTLPL